MAVNKRIDQLPTGTEVNSNSILPIWNNNNTTEGVNIDIVSDYMVGDLESVVYRTNQLLSGGASFLSGLTYDITSLEYLVNGDVYTTTPTTVTTSTGDTTYDRIDLIIADTNGDVTILEGTASENPVQPDVDETTQIVIAIVTVPAGVTVLTVESTLVYGDNLGLPTEWNAYTNSPTIDINYSGITYGGSQKSIYFNATPNTYQASFYYNSDFDTTTQNTIQFKIYNTVVWTTSQRINLKLTSLAGVQIGSTIQVYHGKYGFSRYLTGSWQTISIPISAFSPPTNLISRIYFQSWVSSGLGLSVIIDDIKLTVGPIVPSPIKSWFKIQSDSGDFSYPLTENSTLFLKGGTNLNTVANTSGSVTNSFSIHMDDNISLSSVSATTISGGTFYGDGSNLTGINVNDGYWTGGTGVGSIVSLNQFHNAGGGNSFIGGGYSSTVGGGYYNSSIIGGSYSIIMGASSMIGGSTSSSITGTSSSIIGGFLNLINSNYSFIGGGQSHTASGDNSFVGGGQSNVASGRRSAIIGGIYNHVTASDCSVIGGGGNTVSGERSIVGGNGNTASAYFTTVIGGSYNTVSGDNSFIGGGQNNQSSGGGSFIGGGNSNQITSNNSFIGGGTYCIVTGITSASIGGDLNNVFGSYSFIGGGNSNSVNNHQSVIIGGFGSIVNGVTSFIGGGSLNTVSGYGSTIIGGQSNIVGSDFSVIVGGNDNTLNFGTSRSVIIGGQNIIGTTSDTVYVPTIHATQIPAYDDDTAAGIGGLTTGKFYQTTGSGAAPLNVPGILMIKQ